MSITHSSRPILYFLCLLFTACAFTLRAEPPDPPLALDFELAYQKAVESSPELKQLDARTRMAEGNRIQSGVRPNPEAEFEVENILGTGPFEGTDAAEVTVTVHQPLELGGKRRKRTLLAEKEAAQIAQEREQVLRRLRLTVRQRYYEALFSVQQLELREDQLRLAGQTVEEIQRRVEAARTSKADLHRARLEERQRAFSLSQADRERQQKFKALTRLWDQETVQVTLAGELPTPTEPPEMVELTRAVSTHPELTRFDTAQEIQEQTLRVEQAAAVPDINVFAGVKHTREEGGDSAFVLGVGIPLPLFDRNQGNILHAEAGLDALRAERETVRRSLLSDLSEHLSEQAAAQAELNSLRNEMLPAARETLEEVRKGYKQGQFSLLAVLESRQTLVELREAELDTFSRLLIARAHLEYLTVPAPLSSPIYPR